MYVTPKDITNLGEASMQKMRPNIFYSGLINFNNMDTEQGIEQRDNVVLQEFATGILGARAPPGDESIMRDDETFTRDTPILKKLSPYDLKSFRLLTHDAYLHEGRFKNAKYNKVGEYINLILKLNQ